MTTATPFTQPRTLENAHVRLEPLTEAHADDLAVAAESLHGAWYTSVPKPDGVEAAMKLLLLTHAFDGCDAIAVEFRTHFHNRQSRAAIERLGAKQDGVLRNHRIGPDGIRRDTVVYSILPGEWPAVRRGLESALGREP